MNCTDCAHWNPDRPETDYCDQSDRPPVVKYWELLRQTYPSGIPEPPSVENCPGFVQNPWNAPPDAEKECDLCLGSGYVNDDDCPECHGVGVLISCI